MFCLFCQEPDSIRHTFLNCRWSIQVYSEVIKWFNKENDTTFSPSHVEILFGKKSSNCSQGSFKLLRKFNYTLLFAKYYLYTQKLLKKEINTKEYIRKLTFKYQIEKLFWAVINAVLQPSPLLLLLVIRRILCGKHSLFVFL